LDTFYRTVAGLIADQLNLSISPRDIWNADLGPSINFRRFIQREVLSRLSAPLVWGMDEVDGLFNYPFSNEIFALFRSWHNARALDPSSPWDQLTLVMSYANEAQDLISNPGFSPFNVGTKLTLDVFTFGQTLELSNLYGSPIQNKGKAESFYRLLGGHPYLTCRGLHEMVASDMRFEDLQAIAPRDDGPFGDHLRRILVILLRDLALCDPMREILRGRPCPLTDAFYRLRSAGWIVGESPQEARLLCKLYEDYLTRHLL
jgi:hypothetical protein